MAQHSWSGAEVRQCDEDHEAQEESSKNNCRHVCRSGADWTDNLVLALDEPGGKLAGPDVPEDDVVRE